MNCEKQEVGKTGVQDLARLITRQARKAHLAAVWSSRAGIAPDMQVLDIGAGTGALTLIYARMVCPGGMVLAVDPDEAVLAYLVAAAARDGVAVRTSCQPAEAAIAVPVPPDRVLMTDTLHHAVDPCAVLRSVHAVMHVMSVLLIAEYDPAGAGAMGAPLQRRISQATVRKWLVETGFVPEAPLSAPDEHYTILARPASSGRRARGRKHP